MKKNTKTFLAGAVIAVVAFAGAMAVVGRGDKDEQTLKSWDYEIAYLDEGVVDSDDNCAIVTKEYYKVSDFKGFEVEDDYALTLYGYDNNKEFVTNQALSNMTDVEFAELVNTLKESDIVYVKFMVQEHGNQEISLFEKYSVAKGVTITLSA